MGSPNSTTATLHRETLPRCTKVPCEVALQMESSNAHGEMDAALMMFTLVTVQCRGNVAQVLQRS